MIVLIHHSAGLVPVLGHRALVIISSSDDENTHIPAQHVIVEADSHTFKAGVTLIEVDLWRNEARDLISDTSHVALRGAGGGGGEEREREGKRG